MNLCTKKTISNQKIVSPQPEKRFHRVLSGIQHEIFDFEPVLRSTHSLPSSINIGTSKQENYHMSRSLGIYDDNTFEAESLVNSDENWEEIPNRTDNPVIHDETFKSMIPLS